MAVLLLTGGAALADSPNIPVSPRWERLYKNSPFGNAPEEKKPEPPPPQSQLELHGVVVENGVQWFTFLDVNSKKWITLRKGDTEGSLTIRSYDKEHEAVTVAFQGIERAIGLKPASIQSFTGTLAAPTSVASNSGLPASAQPAAPVMTEERTRLLGIAQAVKSRRDERRMLAAGNSSPRS